MTHPKRSESGIRKRSLTISGHRTSVSLEDVYWEALHDIAAERGRSVQSLVRSIDEKRTASLSSAIRVFVLNRYRKRGDDRTKTKASKSRTAAARTRDPARGAKG